MTVSDATYEGMLRRCLVWADTHDDDQRLVPVSAFRSMLGRVERGMPVTEKQRAYVSDVHAKVFDEPTYRNDWSAGRVPVGKPIATPAVLQKLPLKPPGRR